MIFSDTTNKMFIRMEQLYKYLYTYGVKISSEYGNVYSYEFNARLGRRKCTMYIGRASDVYYDFIYDDGNKNIFKIKSSRFSIDVTPFLSDGFTAENIDLAVYELEQHFLNTYGDIDEILKNKSIEYDKKEKIHNQELKKLL